MLRKMPDVPHLIKDNGELVYEGKRFVERLGTYEALLTSVDENIKEEGG